MPQQAGLCTLGHASRKRPAPSAAAQETGLSVAALMNAVMKGRIRVRVSSPEH